MRVNLQPFVEHAVQKKLAIYNVIIHRNGEISNSFNWKSDIRVNIRSASKSVTSLAVGMAVDEGIVDLDERIADIFFDKLPAHPSDYLCQLKIRDILKMAGGQSQFLLKSTTRDDLDETDWVEYGLAQKFDFKPGTQFVYSNFWPYLCSVIIERKTGRTMLDWLKPRLFEPMNIRNPQWLTCPKGHTLGMGSLFLKAEEMARIGQLCLNLGEWNGRQLVSQSWIQNATSFHISTADTESGESAYGYGYYFWMGREPSSYMAIGAFGQCIVVLPKLQGVIAVSAYEEDEKKIIESVWDFIVPELYM